MRFNIINFNSKKNNNNNNKNETTTINYNGVLFFLDDTNRNTVQWQVMAINGSKTAAAVKITIVDYVIKTADQAMLFYFCEILCYLFPSIHLNQ